LLIRKVYEQLKNVHNKYLNQKGQARQKVASASASASEYKYGRQMEQNQMNMKHCLPILLADKTKGNKKAMHRLKI